MKGIPNIEKIWVTQIAQSGNTYYITSKIKDRSMYFLYQVINGEAKKIKKAPSPLTLESLIK